MAYFYKKDGEIFIPEKINPDLARLAFAIVKTCKLSFKLQMKTTSLNNTLKSGKKEQMLDIMQKCFDKYRKLYNQDMSLTGVISVTRPSRKRCRQPAITTGCRVQARLSAVSLNTAINAEQPRIKPYYT